MNLAIRSKHNEKMDAPQRGHSPQREPAWQMPSRARIAATVVAIIGLLLILAAIMADQAWFDAHFLPVFFVTRADFLLGERLARLALGGLGLALLFLLRPVIRGAFASHGWGELLSQMLALLLALVLALGTAADFPFPGTVRLLSHSGCPRLADFARASYGSAICLDPLSVEGIWRFRCFDPNAPVKHSHRERNTD